MNSEQDLRNLYLSFNARDIDAVLASTAEDVNWPNAWQGGRVHGQAAVREYWIRQWAEIDPHVEPLTIVMRSDDRVAVEVRQIVRTLDGAVISDGHVIHVYEMRGGLVTRMDVEEPQTRD